MRNSTIPKLLAEEAATHHDIIRLNGFEEDYKNLTLKTMAIIDFANAHNYGSMFKTDDDSFVRVDHLWNSIRSIRELPASYLSHCSL
jgi:hypothetical protein